MTYNVKSYFATSVDPNDAVKFTGTSICNGGGDGGGGGDNPTIAIDVFTEIDFFGDIDVPTASPQLSTFDGAPPQLTMPLSDLQNFLEQFILPGLSGDYAGTYDSLIAQVNDTQGAALGTLSFTNTPSFSGASDDTFPTVLNSVQEILALMEEPNPSVYIEAYKAVENTAEAGTTFLQTDPVTGAIDVEADGGNISGTVFPPGISISIPE